MFILYIYIYSFIIILPDCFTTKIMFFIGFPIISFHNNKSLIKTLVAIKIF